MVGQDHSSAADQDGWEQSPLSPIAFPSDSEESPLSPVSSYSEESPLSPVDNDSEESPLSPVESYSEGSPVPSYSQESPLSPVDNDSEESPRSPVESDSDNSTLKPPSPRAITPQAHHGAASNGRDEYGVSGRSGIDTSTSNERTGLREAASLAHPKSLMSILLAARRNKPAGLCWSDMLAARVEDGELLGRRLTPAF